MALTEKEIEEIKELGREWDEMKDKIKLLEIKVAWLMKVHDKLKEKE